MQSGRFFFLNLSRGYIGDFEFLLEPTEVIQRLQRRFKFRTLHGCCLVTGDTSLKIIYEMNSWIPYLSNHKIIFGILQQF
jgi:hypothetical protein